MGSGSLKDWRWSGDNGFDSEELAPVTLVAITSYLLAGNPKTVPAMNIMKVVEFAKPKDGKLSSASKSTGSSDHLPSEHFQVMTGVEMNQTPDKGGAEPLVRFVKTETDKFAKAISSIGLQKQ